MESENKRRTADLKFFDKGLLKFLKEIPNEYLYYYYYRERAVANILAADKTRGEIIAEINENMTKELLSTKGGFEESLPCSRSGTGFARPCIWLTKPAFPGG